MAGKNKRRVPLKDKLKILGGRNEFLNIKRYVKRYIGSPGFNERFNRKLKLLNAGTLFNPWSFTINPNYVDKTVLNLWEGSDSSWANPTGNTVNMTEKGLWRQNIAHEMAHILDNAMIKIYKRSPIWYNPFHKERIQYSSLYPELRQNRLAKAAIKNGIHPDSYMPKSEYDVLYNKYKDVSYDKNNTYHDAFEQEPYADFFAMRYELDKLGLYDSTKANNPFTNDILLKFKKVTNKGEGYKPKEATKYNMAIKRIFLNFNDAQIIKIMNTVAEINPYELLNGQTPPDPNQSYYAKKGTRLIRKPKRK